MKRVLALSATSRNRTSLRTLIPQSRSSRVFINTLKDKDALEEPLDERSKLRMKFSFMSEKRAKDESAVEKFEYPAYWEEDYPAGFSNEMKHEVDKLMIFRDFTMMFDESWQRQIHPLFDGSKIQLSVNCPLEDYDEILFVDDKNTYHTKVVMEVPLKAFKLTDKGIEILTELVGPRYNSNKKSIKLTEDRHTTRVLNHQRLCEILRDLTQTAHEMSTKTELT
uniref:Uncharacterized protein AlNc14C394G11306 n=1 Tax=Albugo laibachii Nc14 TaxID=890382 RepID=F0WYP3_9STRA|nr:conserved hypothetical protein [Albugo laibachii Nc14]|eukprot:CCA26602.1 conserved hypothetical protein [Albugo laibachii Nc14]